MSKLRSLFILLATSITLSLAAPTSSYALEGDAEAGAMLNAIMSPQRNLYGGGVELYARYCFVDGLSVSGGFGLYGARDIDFNRDVGLYYGRLGLIYALDILEWVPAVGIHFSEIISESKNLSWNMDAGHGLGIDFDFQIQYRGIRNIGIALVFAYHLAFTADDYMTAGFSFAWHSDSF